MSKKVLTYQFNNRAKLEIAVSDLTYVRVGSKWNYVCTLVDLSNREIIGYSAGPNKDASIIEKALLSCPYSLKDIKIFHSDRGKEYDNIKTDNILETFEIDTFESNAISYSSEMVIRDLTSTKKKDNKLSYRKPQKYSKSLNI